MDSYKNTTQDRQKVYTNRDDFVFLDPGESCELDLPEGIEQPRVLRVEPEPTPEPEPKRRRNGR